MISLADIHDILQLEQTYSSPLAPCRQAAQSSDVHGQKRWKFLFVFPKLKTLMLEGLIMTAQPSKRAFVDC